MPRSCPGLGLGFASVILSMVSGVTAAQDEPLEGPVAGRIVGKVWHTGVPFNESFQYLQKLREELGIQQGPMVMMMRGPVSMGPGTFSKGPADGQPEMKGTLFFLQTLPEPSLNNPISFQFIGDEKDFKSRIRLEASSRGPMAELIGEDDRYQIKLDFSKLMAATPKVAAPGEGDGEGEGDRKPKEVRTFAITIQAGSGTGGPSKGPGPSMPKSMSTYYRFFDGIMYSSQSKVLHEIDLPTRDSLKLDELTAGHDLYADFDLREIPITLKRAFWSTLESSAAGFLQRFDNEAISDYALRRVIGEGKLELLRAALFDIDRVRFSLSLSPDGLQPFISQLRVTARDNSQLARSFSALSHQNSQLASLKSSETPLVIASTLRLPEWIQPFAAGFVDSARLKLRAAAGGDEGAGVLVDNMIQPIADSVQTGIVDAAVSLRGSVQEGLIVAGGLRLQDAEHFLTSIESLLLIHGTPIGISVSRSTIRDYQVLSVRSDKVDVPAAGTATSINLHLVATGSWLWMTSGGDPALSTSSEDPAFQALSELVDDSADESRRTGEAVPLLIRFRLNQWLGETQQDFSRVPQQLLTSLERWVSEVTTPRAFSISVNGKAIEQKKDEPPTFNSYAAKLFRPETSELEVAVRTAPRELVVDATVGTAVVRFFAAQYIDSQSRMFRNIPMQFSVPSGEGRQIQRIQIGN